MHFKHVKNFKHTLSSQVCFSVTGPWGKVSGHQAQERASGKLWMCILILVGNWDWWHRWCPWAGNRPLQDFRIWEVPQFLQVQWIYQHGMGLHLCRLNGRHKFSGFAQPGPLEQLLWWHSVKYMWIYVQGHSCHGLGFRTQMHDQFQSTEVYYLNKHTSARQSRTGSPHRAKE